MPQGIARKLVIYITIMVIVVEGAFAVLNVNSQENELLNEMILSGELASQTIVSTTWHAMLEDRRESVYQMMDNVGKQGSIDRVRVLNKTGRVMFASGSARGGLIEHSVASCGLCHVPDEAGGPVEVAARTRIYRGPDGHRFMGMFTPIYNEPSCSNAACHAHPRQVQVLGGIDVIMPLERVDHQMADLRFRSVLLSAVSVFLLAFFVILFTRRVVQQPVAKLIEATKSVGTGEITAPLEIEAEDELGELATSFRSMQDRLRVSNQQIRDFTDTLERRVDERTQQLKETEQKLFQSARLASLGQLSASVAHEINNPLGGVINFSKLMQRLLKDGQIPPDRIDDFRNYLDHVVTETTRCGNIVRDLVVFARQSAPRRASHDFNEIIRRTLSVVHHRLELGEVRAETILDDDLPLVLCDGSQVQQIVTNLVLNAAEAMEAGVVTVRTRHLPETDEVRLEVSDKGVGISPENLAKIYDPFFSTKEEGKGTGLGLAVVYGIVEAHSGRIDVKSKAGEGTTFLVTLPLNGPEMEPNESHPQLGPEL